MFSLNVLDDNENIRNSPMCFDLCDGYILPMIKQKYNETYKFDFSKLTNGESLKQLLSLEEIVDIEDYINKLSTIRKTNKVIPYVMSTKEKLFTICDVSKYIFLPHIDSYNYENKEYSSYFINYKSKYRTNIDLINAIDVQTYLLLKHHKINIYESTKLYVAEIPIDEYNKFMDNDYVYIL